MNMNLKKSFLVLTVGVAAAGLFAAEAEQELVQESGRGHWSFSAGPAWRSRVKMETRGTVFAPSTTPRQTVAGKDMQDPANWNAGNTELRQNPYPASDVNHERLWGVASDRTEIYGVPGQDYVVNRSDEERPLGLNLQGCYDFLRGETWAVGLNARFAGYWNMESSSSGFFHAGGTYTQNYRDWSLFDNATSGGTFADEVDSSIGDRPTINGGSDMKDSYVDKGSHIVNTRLRSDLYQIGLGPKITWTPFAGVCEWMDWLDVYGGVEILCNIAYSKLEADGASGTSTDCLLGFGGNIGLTGNITDWLGVYGQVGYEWIDKTDVSAGSFSADIDYSSLVLSAGVQFRF